MYNRLNFILVSICMFFCLNSQEIFQGYTLFTPLIDGPQGGGESYTRLIANDGEIINQWNHEVSAATAPYLLSDSTLICPFKIDNPYLVGSAYGGKIIRYSWSGDILWEYEYSDTNYIQHHDIEPMPNGNILLVSWDRKTYQEALEAGRENLENEMWPDKIIELHPIGYDSATVVWEWKFWNHLIQDSDSNLANYGIISEHPELININIGDMPLAVMGIADWTHINSVDYNENLDQIIISSRNMSEFYVIDHSTTTEEASGHSGGNSGMGGDILFRWGNPMNYDRGTVDNRILIGQHDVNWIESGHPNSGNIIMFNNGATTSFGQDYTQSSIIEISPPIDTLGAYYIDNINAFAPDTIVWSYYSDFFSPFMSGAKRLPNGNTLITVATEMRIFEVTNEGEILWDYTHAQVGQTGISKASKYPLDFLDNPYNIFGDINGDYNIDILDILLMVNFILDLADLTDEQILLADFNDDGYLTVEDVLLLINFILL